ncbi:Yip1 family protein [Streptomyces sp. NPDC002838]|uniref:Yip1 family protein n=1 Tax=Streptomyces sp. NPDC002838 TaxID=3154436 RepID=UPI0033227B0C
MSIRPWVIVEAPDSRGLRQVIVGSETVGSAWSLGELRKMLDRLGYPENMDMEDPASVCWRGGDSRTWPDRAGRRRTTIVLMMAGMLASMALNTVIGWPDATGALTFAQRISGALFVLSGAVQGAAAIAVLDYWGRRQFNSSGAVVLLGALVALATDSLLLFMWFEETEYTPYLLAFMPLWCWSLWALWLLVREKSWQRIPRPKTFAAGVVATALLTAVSLAYSTMYQPAAAPMHFILKAEFGRARADHRLPFVHVPLKLYMKNAGGIPVYIINNDYTVYGRNAKYSEKGEWLEEWRRSLDEKREEDAHRYVDKLKYTPISSDRFYRPGNWLDVGQEYAMERALQIPRSTEFDTMNIVLQITYMRKDRGKLDVAQFRRAHRSWNKDEGRYYCAPARCGEELYYHGRVRHNNNLINVTRRPRYVTAIWSPEKRPIYSISSFHFEGPVARSEEKRDVNRYGASTAYADSEVAVTELLSSSGADGV